MAAKRVTYQGRTLNQRTIDMFEAVEYLTGLQLTITQGSYNAGGVTASAGTHDGGGAVDIRAINLSSTQRKAVVLAMRQVGFAAWLRNPTQGDWPWHIHGIAAGDPDLSRGAANQVVAYRNGRNGLANNGPDDGPGGYRNATWEAWEAAHPDWKGLTVGQVEDIKAYIDKRVGEAEARIYAGPRYAALQTGINEIVAGLKSHDTEEDSRYGYYAQKLNDILAQASAADDSADIAALSAKVDKLTAAVEKLAGTAPKA